MSSRPVPSHLVANLGARITLGDRVFISYGAAISSSIEVSIGDGTRLGPFGVIMDSDFHVAGDRNAVAEAKAVRIGRGVVLGSRVSVLRGSEIGDGARVQSGSVVSGAVPPGAVVGGVPARTIVVDQEADVPLLIQRVLGLPSIPGPLEGPDDSTWLGFFGRSQNSCSPSKRRSESAGRRGHEGGSVGRRADRGRRAGSRPRRRHSMMTMSPDRSPKRAALFSL